MRRWVGVRARNAAAATTIAALLAGLVACSSAPGGGATHGSDSSASSPANQPNDPVAKACRTATAAWSKFTAAYKNAGTDHAKILATTTAGASYAQVAFDLSQAALLESSEAPVKREESLSQDATSVRDDLTTLMENLQASDDRAASFVFSDQLTPDETTFETACK